MSKSHGQISGTCGAVLFANGLSDLVALRLRPMIVSLFKNQADSCGCKLLDQIYPQISQIPRIIYVFDLRNLRNLRICLA